MDESLYDEFYKVERTHWWSVGMRAIFATFLGEGIRGVAAPVVLDVGCGTGIVLDELGRYGRIVGIDAALQGLLYTRKRQPTAWVCQADLIHLPFPAEAFDAVLALDVIEHLDDDVAALREIHRVLRPGGVAVVNVPAFASLWSEKDVANHHRRRYTRATLKAAIESSRLTVERATYTNAALFPAIWVARRFDRVVKRPWNPRAEYYPPGLVNTVLGKVLRLEGHLLQYLDLPFGSSVTCLVRKQLA